MNFSNLSLFGWLVPLAALPLAIHVLNRRFPSKFMFSSVEELKRTIAGRSMISRWRHWLMLLLRTLALAALVAAFLKPVAGSRTGEVGKRRHAILLVDHSLSMTYGGEGSSALAKAHAEVRRLLGSFDADDRFQVIRVDHAPAAAFPGFSADKAAALDFLEKSPPPMTGAAFDGANRMAAELSRDLKEPPDMYYFSDFQRKDWADVGFSMLPAGARLFFVDAAAGATRPNRAITDLRLMEGAVIAGGEVEVTARVANFSAQPWSGKIEAGFGPAHLREREITLGPWAETDAKLVVPVPEGGLLPMRAALEKDDLRADDERFLVVGVHDREEVAILSGSAAEESAPPSLFLKTAVNPYGDGQGSYRPRFVVPAALQPAALASASRVIASRLPALNENQLGTLAAFLRGGGGMIWFCDGEADGANLEQLARITGETPPLRLMKKLGSENLPDGAMQVARGDFKSRFLRLFEGERRQNLALLEFYEIHHAVSTGQGKILLSYADGTPALAECQIGAGTLLLCNFSVSEASSNLARQRLFPAWIHEMLLRMGGGNSAMKEPFQVGDTLAGETWAAESNGREMSGPAGSVARVSRESTGERARLRFTAPLPGIYRMDGGDGRPLLAFAVNVDANQSDLRPMDPAILPERAGTGKTEAALVEGEADYHRLARGRPAFHWFVLAALGLLLLEGALFKRPAAASGRAAS